MKKSSNYIKLEFLSRSTNEGFARSAVAAFASQLDPTLDELGDIKTAVSEAVYHRVVKGDTLWALAGQYGLSLAELIALNPQIKNPNLIRVGEEVRVR